MSNALRRTPIPPTPGHWYGSELCDGDWRLNIPDAVIDELDTALEQPQATGDEAAAHMPVVRAFLVRLQQRLFHGSGVAIAGRLPVQEWGKERARRAVSLLAHLMGPPTEQTHDGVTLYAVEDRAVPADAGVRRSLTNLEQPFHSDGPWIRNPPWIVALYCLHPSPTGGLSGCVSLRAMVDDLAQDVPQLATRLTRDVFWHRQFEHAHNEPAVSQHPMVWHDDAGRWCGRLYANYVRHGYRQAGQPMDAEIQQALQHLEHMSVEPHRRLQYRLEAGDVAWLNNRWCVHSRTGFESAKHADAPRLLVRVWHRLPGDIVTLDG